MIVDAHNHVYYHGLNADGVVAEMDRFGYQVAWLFTWYHPPGQHVATSHATFNPANARADGTHAGIVLRDVAEACARYPRRFVAGYCPNPEAGDAAALFEAAYHTHQVRVCGEWSYRLQLDDPRSVELFRCAGRLGAPVVLHIDAPYLPHPETLEPHYQEHWYGGDLDALERALRACPDTVFVGHAPGFWRYISGEATREPGTYPSVPPAPGGRLFELFDAYPNLWADLSAASGMNALRRQQDGGVAFLQRYADRMLFGRDAPGDQLQRYLLGLDLDAAVAGKIFCENALRLVPLGDLPGDGSVICPVMDR